MKLAKYIVTITNMNTFPWWMNCVNLIKSPLHLKQSLRVILVHDTNMLLQQLTGGTQQSSVLTPWPTSTPEHAMRPCGTPRDWGQGTARARRHQPAEARASPHPDQGALWLHISPASALRESCPGPATACRPRACLPPAASGHLIATAMPEGDKLFNPPQ